MTPNSPLDIRRDASSDSFRVSLYSRNADARDSSVEDSGLYTCLAVSPGINQLFPDGTLNEGIGSGDFFPQPVPAGINTSTSVQVIVQGTQ